MEADEIGLNAVLSDALTACREKQQVALSSNNRELLELLLTHEEHLVELCLKAAGL